MVDKRRYRSDRYRLILVSAVYTCGERLHKIRDRPKYVKSDLQIIVSAVVCAANIAENTLLVPIIGGIGAAISTGLSYIVFFAMRTILSNKYFPMKWGMGKFSLITLLFLAYAWYNTFHSFGMVTVLGYVSIFAIIVFNYRDVIRDGFRLLKKRFS